jgi:hypothetical protein
MSADSLVYEYYVGKMFVNKYVTKLPCFLETYSIYHYSSEYVYKTLKKEKTNNSDTLKNGGLTVFENFNNYVYQSCDDPTKICILIQHLNNPITLDTFLKKRYSNYVLLTLLLQIYLPLGELMNNFTHNDLHTKNILLYKVPNNKYIEMTYILRDGAKITFKTQYIVKIIDYGRAFFKDMNSDESSEKLFNLILHDERCKNIFNSKHKTTGDLNREKLVNIGYGFFEETVTADDYFINSFIGNISKDLWLAHMIKYKIMSGERANTPINKKLIDLFTNIVIKLDDDDEDDRYIGYPIKTEDCVKFEKANNELKSCNVKMFSDNLVKIYNELKVSINEYFNIYDTNYTTDKCEGKMTIYLDLTKDIDFQLTRLTFDRPIILDEENDEPLMVAGKTKKRNKKRHKKTKKTKKKQTKKRH